MKKTILHMNPLQLSLLVAIPFVLMFSIINFSQGFNGLGQIELLMVASLASLYLWTRKVEMLFVQQNLFIIHAATLFSLLFLQGGFSGIGFIWSFGFPFIACLSAGSRIGLIWTVIYALIIAILSATIGDLIWQKAAYISLAYVAFSLIAAYTITWRELREENSLHRILDTTSRLKHKEHALLNNKMSHRTLLDSLPHALAVHCNDRWVYCNPIAADLFGASGTEEIIGTSIYDYVQDDDLEKVKERIANMIKHARPAPVVDETIIRKDGQTIVARIQSSPVIYDGEPAFLVTAEDSRQHTSNQPLSSNDHSDRLEHAQRLESLGVLAGGIAHDFNNLLAAISGNAELARSSLDKEAEATTHIDNISDACDHAAELCKQMLAYAGKGSYELDILDLNEMVKSTGKLIRASVSSHIALKIKLAKTLPGIEGDMAQIQQLILNFIVNSADAIGPKSGEIKVSTGARNIDRQMLDKLYNGSCLKPGQYVIIEVSDTGRGMSLEMISKIFDPFFTTKETGSGLGLSAVLGIVRGHHGAIQVHSSEGRGTAFRVYLPSTDQEFKATMISTVEVDAWQGDGKVLIVDDDMRVRQVGKAFIESLHFTVMTADDGKEGLEVFAKHHTNLAAVLLDMTMPVLGGVEAMAGMREIDSNVPIILVSGYSEVEAGSLIAGDRPDAFLQKPFKAKTLKTTLYEVMHSTSKQG
ncbi:ATP-binding protein [Mariprofundus sp. EBB-1]|uniref:hybrid sensor histidine kinase/response regulator n=1 Tax=Mariprofundus sp. EBB-1 TaxID=2650971 RepID=UPI001F178B99|nr:ATP-binding protein [Mariprofundus sp. EBB-1]